MGDIPRGQALMVEGEEGDFYKIVAYVAKSVTSPLPVALPGPTLVYPVLGRKFQVNHPYGEPRNYGKHEGLDLYAQSGDAIVAALDGVVDGVRTTDPGTGYGIYVRVYHDLRSTLGKEYRTWYGHLKDVAVKEGQAVKAGETVLGHADTTGNSTGVHLHLTLQDLGLHNAMIVDGAVDPIEHLV
jgi:murein DD-endopeptidase MepM/ murein hydrolase activator NlpD